MPICLTGCQLFLDWRQDVQKSCVSGSLTARKSKVSRRSNKWHFWYQNFFENFLATPYFLNMSLNGMCAVLESHRSTLRLLNLFVLGGRSGVMISDSHHWKQLHSIQGDADISIFRSDWSLALIRISMLAIGEWVLGYFGVVLVAISHCDG